MSILNDLIQPAISLVAKGIEASLDMTALARLILFLLGPVERDEQLAKLGDDAVKGGAIIEALDKEIILGYIKKLRKWAEDKIAEE